MNLEKLQTKLLLAARSNTPDETVPYAFECRIMARLHKVSSLEVNDFWERVLWKSALVCTAVSIALGAWSLQTSWERKPVSLETTIFSMAQQLGDTW